MLLNINEIKINDGRREVTQEGIQNLIESFQEVGLMNPITVTTDHTLVAGLHRLEAAKQLGWTEIECNIIDADDLHAELAEIDENYVRTNLTPLESSKLMLRRKEIYETLHPETKNGAAQGNGAKRALAAEGDESTLTDNLSMSASAQSSTESENSTLTDNLSVSPRVKSFAEDTAELLGVDARTVRRLIQIAKNLTPKAQEIIKSSGAKVTRENLLKLSRLPAEQQTEAANQLVSGKIKSVDEYGMTDKAETNNEAEPFSYYQTGNFIVESFGQAVSGLRGVPNGHRDHLDNYRQRLSAEQLQSMVEFAEYGIDLLTEYKDFLTKELEYKETEEVSA